MKVVKHISKSGKNINEDALQFGDDFVSVMDGATGLKQNWISENSSDAQWYVEKIGNYITINFSRYKNKRKMLKDAISDVSKNVKTEHISKDCAEIFPSASLVLIFETRENIEIYNLGDCTTIVKFHTGKVKKIYDDSVSKLDSNVIEDMKTISLEKGIPFAETRKYVDNKLIDNRKKKNKKNGYWVMGFDRSAIDKIQMFKWRKSEIESICSMTDGFANYVDLYKIENDYKKYIEKVEKEDIELIYDELRNAEDDDPNCEKYPRFKQKDDATLVYIKP